MKFNIILIVVTFCFLAHSGCESSYERQQAEKRELRSRVARAVEKSQAAVYRFDFDTAYSGLYELQDEALRYPELYEKLDSAIDSVNVARAKWQRGKMRGWVPFEGRMIEPSEKENILRSREEKREEIRQRQLAAKQEREERERRSSRSGSRNRNGLDKEGCDAARKIIAIYKARGVITSDIDNVFVVDTGWFELSFARKESLGQACLMAVNCGQATFIEVEFRDHFTNELVGEYNLSGMHVY